MSLREQNVCKCRAGKLVECYCPKCKTYMCTDCSITNHIEHPDQLVYLEEKCSRYLADFQKLSRVVSVLADQRTVHIKGMSINNVINNLKKEISDTKISLHKDIDESSDNALKSINTSPLIQQFVAKRAELCASSDELLDQEKNLLKEISKDLLKNIADNRLESADKMLSEDDLKKHTETVRKLYIEAGRDLDFIYEMQKLKNTEVKYSYDPMAIMGMVNIQSSITKPDRIMQFDRNKNAVIIYYIDTQKTTVTSVNSEFILPFRFITIEFNNNIYLSGGDNDREYFLKSFYLYNEIQGGLIPMADMQLGRSRHSLVGVNGQSFIYAIGGETEFGVTDTCEIYNIKENIWTSGPRMKEPRCGFGSCYFPNSIYVIGGWNNYYLDSIEVLDLSKTEWTKVKLSKDSILPALQFPGAFVTQSEKIFIFGGYKEDEELSKKCFIFDPNTSKIEKTVDLKEEDAFVSSELKAVKNKVYSFGYEKGGVHIYNEDNNEWSCILYKILIMN